MINHQEQNRDCRGIWIPIEIWEIHTLTWLEKHLLAEINSFSLRDNWCYKSNETFAHFFQTSDSAITKAIKKLKENGYLVSKFDGRNRYLKSTYKYHIPNHILQIYF